MNVPANDNLAALHAATAGMSSDNLSSVHNFVLGWVSRSVAPEDFRAAISAALNMVRGDAERRVKREIVTVSYEARCERCLEIFCPADADDLIHIQREDGEPCGGQGTNFGAWGLPA